MGIEDFQIADFIWEKILITTGEEQKVWVNKLDIFTSKNLFKQYNQTERLKEVDIIRIEISEMMR